MRAVQWPRRRNIEFSNTASNKGVSLTIREFERRTPQRRESDPAHDREIGLNQYRVLSFALNGISPATGRRILKSDEGPAITRLSPRRIGITLANNAAWQAARSR